ncbi:MAG: VCBS repeat-containing protein [Bryobacterales bacterium]|nr:VCBS repeat-containing protein [Bryobacterales bacterium]
MPLLRCLALLFAASAAPLSFPDVQLLEEKGETSAGVSLGDLNGDGRMDLMLAKGRHWPLHNRVLLNNGQGGYTASNLGAQPDRTYSAALADIDRDGDLDVVVSNDAPDRKLIYKNDGKARFTEAGTFGEPGWTTRYVTLGDLNGDGYPDIVAANRGGGPKPVASFVCFNDRRGGFPACQAVPSESATSIAVRDLDGDGAADLFVPHRDGGQSAVLWNDGQGRFASTTKVGPEKAVARISAVGDLDGDQRPDLVYIDEAKRAAFVMYARGKRAFSEAQALPGNAHTPYALALGDLNRDGRLDIVVGLVKAPGVVYFNDGTGRNFQQVPWNDGAGVVYGMVFGDVNGDKVTDIIAARSDAPNAVWFGKPAKP